jgi:hypothetical protein
MNKGASRHMTTHFIRFMILYQLLMKDMMLQLANLCEISGSQGSEYEDGYLIISRVMMEAESTYETSVNFYQITWHNKPEDSHLHS